MGAPVSAATLQHLKASAELFESGWIGDAISRASMFHDQVRRDLGEEHEVTVASYAYLQALLAEHYGAKTTFDGPALRAAYLNVRAAVAIHTYSEVT